MVLQTVSYLALLLMTHYLDGGRELYIRWVLRLNGIGSLLLVLPIYYLYQKDRAARVTGGVVQQQDRSFFFGESILLILLGGAFSLYGNLLMNILNPILDSSDYFRQMSLLEQGYSLPELFFWAAVVAPFVEEGIFRWLIYLRLRDYIPERAGKTGKETGQKKDHKRSIRTAALISAIIFGGYHGNLVQAVYAALLGFLFALVLEWTGNIKSSFLLHFGANASSLFLSEIVIQFSEQKQRMVLGYMMLAYLAVLIYGIRYFHRAGSEHSERLE